MSRDGLFVRRSRGDKRHVVHLFNLIDSSGITECGLDTTRLKTRSGQIRLVIAASKALDDIDLTYSRNCVTCGKARAGRTRGL